MHIFEVGEKITWRNSIKDDFLRGRLPEFIEKQGKIMTVRKVEKALISTSHPQTVWVGDLKTDRYSGFWFEPVISGFTLDAIA